MIRGRVGVQHFVFLIHGREEACVEEGGGFSFLCGWRQLALDCLEPRPVAIRSETEGTAVNSNAHPTQTASILRYHFDSPCIVIWIHRHKSKCKSISQIVIEASLALREQLDQA